MMTTMKKSSKKRRELKDLGPTLDELEPFYTPLGPSFGPWEDEEELWHIDEEERKDCALSPGLAARCRETALAYYNKKHGTNYEPVDTTARSNYFFWDAMWYHCNFTAKKPDDDQERLFFAEIRRSNPLPYTLRATCCRILRAKSVAGCTECSQVLHPTRGFCRGIVEYGHRLYKGPTLRTRPERFSPVPLSTI